MAIGKAFGGGIMPVGACIGTDEVWKKYIEQPFLLTTTFGGNPLALSASIATIVVLLEENIIEETVGKGDLFIEGLIYIQKRYPSILKEVRGKGLMIGIEFTKNEYGIQFSKNMFEKNILVAGTLANAETIRIEPSLTITNDEIIYVLESFEDTIKNIEKNCNEKIIKSKL
jgi:putrescine aminotransferase